MSKKVLIVTGEFPYTANHGGRKDIVSRIELLTKSSDVEVSLICTTKVPVEDKDIEAVRNKFHEIIFVQRQSNISSLLFSLLMLLPLQVSTRRLLKEYCLSEKYDYVILEGEYVYPIIKNTTLKTDKVILRVHNFESLYFRSLARSSNNFLKKMYYLFDSFLFKMNENKVYNDLDEYWFISSDELKKVESTVQNTRWIPPHIDEPGRFNDDKFVIDNSKNLLIVGSFFMPNNIEGIQWYFAKVHQHVIREVPDVRISLVGNGRGVIPDELINIQKTFDNVTIHEGVSDQKLNDIYAENYIFLNPMQNGAGVKIKTVDAVTNSLAIVTTSVGAEGTGFIDIEHMYIEDSPEGFAQAVIRNIKNIDDAKMMSERAYKMVCNNYVQTTEYLLSGS